MQQFTKQVQVWNCGREASTPLDLQTIPGHYLYTSEYRIMVRSTLPYLTRTQSKCLPLPSNLRTTRSRTAKRYWSGSPAPRHHPRNGRARRLPDLLRNIRPPMRLDGTPSSFSFSRSQRMNWAAGCSRAWLSPGFLVLDDDDRITSDDEGHSGSVALACRDPDAALPPRQPGTKARSNRSRSCGAQSRSGFCRLCLRCSQP